MELVMPVWGRIASLARKYYRRWLTPVLNELWQQRAKLLWFVWGYAGLLTIPYIPSRTRFRWLRSFLVVDWNIRHAHTPAEIVAICRVLAERAGRSREVVVEAGCWQGGSTAKLSTVCSSLGYRLAVFDSFAGVEAGSAVAGEHDFSGEYAASETLVRAHVSKYGDINVCFFYKGWFAETLARTPVEDPVRLAYIDCDLVKGTAEVLAGVMPSLVPDGCIFSQDCQINPVRRFLADPATWLQFNRGMPTSQIHSHRLVSFRFDHR